MAFRRGDEVEISSKEEGFLGSYYAARVLGEVSNKQFLVQYKTLLTDDESRPLREIVRADEVRPVPTVIPASGFGMHDKVDAFDNDGWWVGRITGKSGSKYYVYFDSTGDEIGYSLSQLRVHQEWLNGKWFSSKRRDV